MNGHGVVSVRLHRVRLHRCRRQPDVERIQNIRLIRQVRITDQNTHTP